MLCEWSNLLCVLNENGPNFGVNVPQGFEIGSFDLVSRLHAAVDRYSGL